MGGNSWWCNAISFKVLIDQVLQDVKIWKSKPFWGRGRDQSSPAKHQRQAFQRQRRRTEEIKSNPTVVKVKNEHSNTNEDELNEK